MFVIFTQSLEGQNYIHGNTSDKSKIQRICEDSLSLKIQAKFELNKMALTDSLPRFLLNRIDAAA